MSQENEVTAKEKSVKKKMLDAMVFLSQNAHSIIVTEQETRVWLKGEQKAMCISEGICGLHKLLGGNFTQSVIHSDQSGADQIVADAPRGHLYQRVLPKKVVGPKVQIKKEKP